VRLPSLKALGLLLALGAWGRAWATVPVPLLDAPGSVGVARLDIQGRPLPQAEVPRLRVVQLPAALQVGAAYGLTVRADAPAAAQAFASALRQPPAQAVLQRLGFGLP